jgi:hypothetical protein
MINLRGALGSNLPVRLLQLLAGIVCLLALSCADALADKRVALVIGNSGYKNAAQLPNPSGDASAVAALLKSAGFEVVLSKNDLSNIEMRRAVREFTEASASADIAVFFYAGHGIEIDGNNYLIPTDAALDSDLDVEDETLSLDRIMHAMDSVKRLRLVILDACRDNPFSRTMKRSLASRSMGRGLAQVDPMTSDTLVAFAARAGSTASDGSGAHSPFTTALLKYIAMPGLDIRLALGRVRDDVMAATGRKQEPFVYGSLGGSEVDLVLKQDVAVAPPPVVNTGDIARDYEFAERIGTKEAWDAFLANHDRGFYAELAKAARDKVLTGHDDDKRQAAESAQRKATAERPKPPEQDGANHVALAVAPAKPSEPAPAAKGDIADGDIARLLQVQLKRVGCDSGSTDGAWNEGARRALARFNEHAGTKFDVKLASIDALHSVEQHAARVCPLVCGKNQRVEGEKCVDAPKAAKSDRKPGESRRTAKTDNAGSGQIFCGERTGCVPVPKNCKIEYSDGAGGSGGPAFTSQQHLVCH